MKKISFTIWGTPVTWKRVMRGKFGQSFNDGKMVSYQNRVIDLFRENTGFAWVKTKQPVMIELKAYFKVPQSFPKWKKRLAEKEALPYLSFPDADNLMKNIADALQDTAYDNDSCVTDILVRKRYSPNPRAEVTVWFLDNPEKPGIIDENPEQLSLF